MAGSADGKEKGLCLMTVSKRTALIGDIGGTHARFAICDIDELSVAHFAVFETKMFPSRSFTSTKVPRREIDSAGHLRRILSRKGVMSFSTYCLDPPRITSHWGWFRNWRNP